MDKGKVLEHVKCVIKRVQDLDVCLDANLKSDLGLDSLDLLEIVYELEGNLSIRISESDYEEWNTVEDIVHTVCKELDVEF